MASIFRRQPANRLRAGDLVPYRSGDARASIANEFFEAPPAGDASADRSPVPAASQRRAYSLIAAGTALVLLTGASAPELPPGQASFGQTPLGPRYAAQHDTLPPDAPATPLPPGAAETGRGAVVARFLTGWTFDAIREDTPTAPVGVQETARPPVVRRPVRAWALDAFRDGIPPGGLLAPAPPPRPRPALTAWTTDGIRDAAADLPPGRQDTPRPPLVRSHVRAWASDAFRDGVPPGTTSTTAPAPRLRRQPAAWITEGIRDAVPDPLPIGAAVVAHSRRRVVASQGGIPQDPQPFPLRAVVVDDLPPGMGLTPVPPPRRVYLAPQSSAEPADGGSAPPDTEIPPGTTGGLGQPAPRPYLAPKLGTFYYVLEPDPLPVGSGSTSRPAGRVLALRQGAGTRPDRLLDAEIVTPAPFAGVPTPAPARRPATVQLASSRAGLLLDAAAPPPPPFSETSPAIPPRAARVVAHWQAPQTLLSLDSAPPTPLPPGTQEGTAPPPSRTPYLVPQSSTEPGDAGTPPPPDTAIPIGRTGGQEPPPRRQLPHRPAASFWYVLEPAAVLPFRAEGTAPPIRTVRRPYSPAAFWYPPVVAVLPPGGQSFQRPALLRRAPRPTTATAVFLGAIPVPVYMPSPGWQWARGTGHLTTWEFEPGRAAWPIPRGQDGWEFEPARIVWPFTPGRVVWEF